MSGASPERPLHPAPFSFPSTFACLRSSTYLLAPELGQWRAARYLIAQTGNGECEAAQLVSSRLVRLIWLVRLVWLVLLVWPAGRGQIAGAPGRRRPRRASGAGAEAQLLCAGARWHVLVRARRARPLAGPRAAHAQKGRRAAQPTVRGRARAAARSLARPLAIYHRQLDRCIPGLVLLMLVPVLAACFSAERARRPGVCECACLRVCRARPAASPTQAGTKSIRQVQSSAPSSSCPIRMIASANCLQVERGEPAVQRD